MRLLSVMVSSSSEKRGWDISCFLHSCSLSGFPRVKVVECSTSNNELANFADLLQAACRLLCKSAAILVTSLTTQICTKTYKCRRVSRGWGRSKLSTKHQSVRRDNMEMVTIPTKPTQQQNQANPAVFAKKTRQRFRALLSSTS